MKLSLKTASHVGLTAALVLSIGSTSFAQAPAQPTLVPQVGETITATDGRGGHMMFTIVARDRIVQKIEEVASSVRSEQASNNPNLELLKADLAKARTELHSLHNQLGLQLATQDLSVAVFVSVTTLGLTTAVGRVGLEGSEKLLAGADAVIPDKIGTSQGLFTRVGNWVLKGINAPLKWGKGAVDRIGKGTGKVGKIAFVVGGTGSVAMFFISKEFVADFTKQVGQALERVEQLQAELQVAERSVK